MVGEEARVTTALPRPGPVAMVGASSVPGVLRTWVPRVAAAEIAGFGIPAAAGTLAWMADLGPAPFLVVMVCAGIGEGALLGAGQAAALRRIMPGVDGRRWVVATALAAGFAWCLGMLPGTLGDFGAPSWVSIAGWVVGGPLILASIPLPQAVLLGRVVPAARWRWAWITAGAWAAALPISFLPGPFVDEATPAAVLFAGFALAGAAMALVMALVTGWGLRGLLREPPFAAL